MMFSLYRHTHGTKDLYPRHFPMAKNVSMQHYLWPLLKLVQKSLPVKKNPRSELRSYWLVDAEDLEITLEKCRPAPRNAPSVGISVNRVFIKRVRQWDSSSVGKWMMNETHIPRSLRTKPVCAFFSACSSS